MWERIVQSMNTLVKTGIYLMFILILGLAACTPVEDSNSASISGRVFFDCDKDGDCADDEDGIAGMCVRLYFGECGENMLQNHTSDENGNFLFSELAAGTYCIMADPELLTCGFGGNHPTTSISRHVTVEDGMHAEVEWFGFGNLSGGGDGAN